MIDKSLARGYARRVLREAKKLYSTAADCIGEESNRTRLNAVAQTRMLKRIRREAGPALIHALLSNPGKEYRFFFEVWNSIPAGIPNSDYKETMLSTVMISVRAESRTTISKQRHYSSLFIGEHAIKRLIMRSGITEVEDVLNDLRLAVTLGNVAAYAFLPDFETHDDPWNFFMQIALPTRTGMLMGVVHLVRDALDDVTVLAINCRTYLHQDQLPADQLRLREELLEVEPTINSETYIQVQCDHDKKPQIEPAARLREIIDNYGMHRLRPRDDPEIVKLLQAGMDDDGLAESSE
jgi:hypothetical protein